MHPLTKRIALLVSFSCLILGVFLLVFNLKLIPDTTLQIALNLWPLVLVIAGILLVADSIKKRMFTRTALTAPKEFPLSIAPETADLLCKVQFSYGTLSLGPSRSSPTLTVTQFGSAGDPSILKETRGGTCVLSLGMPRPLFASNFQLLNTWSLALPRSLPLGLELHLHEANLSMDLRGLSVESIDLHAGAGKQEIFIGRNQRKLQAQIYSSSSDLSLVLPTKAYVQVLLLNPFCRMDYPQGDFERREDGSLTSTGPCDPQNSIEISIDGPIRNLMIDVDDGPEAAP